jgi:hypothetical protein
MLYKKSEITDSQVQIEALTNILRERFDTIQVYLEGNFIREMVYLCLSGSVLEFIARNALYSGWSIESVMARDPHDLYSLSMSIMTVTSIIIAILGARYQAKSVERNRINTTINNLVRGEISKLDRTVIHRSYSVIKKSGKDVELDEESVKQLLNYLIEI